MAKAKDPDRPKRTQMVTNGSSVWKSMSNREKQPYEDKSAKLKDKYKRELKIYQDKLKTRRLREGCTDTDKPKTPKRDPNKPKKALSAYMLFMKDFRKKNARRGWDVLEMVKKGASVWKTLTTNEKCPYELTARRNLEKYRIKLEKYKNKKRLEARIGQTKPNDTIQKKSRTSSARRKSRTTKKRSTRKVVRRRRKT